jgi:hypothetical protein
MHRPRTVLVSLGACAAALGVWLTHSSGSDRPTATRAPISDRSQPARHLVPSTPQAAPATVTVASPPGVPTAAVGQVIVQASWGGAQGQLGRREANESSPEGPMSFVVDARGRSFVLDQINSRVSVFESGGATRTIPLPSDTIQDIALRDDEGIVALDRIGSQDVAFIDATGTVTMRVALAGEGVETGGDVTALSQRPDGTWVEVKHEQLVKIADASGAPVVPRSSVPGRFTANGGFLRASRSGSSAVSLALIEPGKRARALARVELPMRVWQILGLEIAPDNRIVLAADLYEESPAPAFERTRASEALVVLSGDGRELERFELPAIDGAEESFRRVRIGADGALYHMGFSESGVTIRRISP